MEFFKGSEQHKHSDCGNTEFYPPDLISNYLFSSLQCIYINIILEHTIEFDPAESQILLGVKMKINSVENAFWWYT